MESNANTKKIKNLGEAIVGFIPSFFKLCVDIKNLAYAKAQLTYFSSKKIWKLNYRIFTFIKNLFSIDRKKHSEYFKRVV